MRKILCAFLVFSSYETQAQDVPASTLKEMVAANISYGGRIYQLAKHCGATAETLATHRARFDAKTEGEPFYAEFGINREQVYREGQKDGDALYLKVKQTPDRDRICAETLETVKRQAAQW
jgi:hypothetical protein